MKMNYETPFVEVIDVVAEGVFCSSVDTGSSDILDWEDDGESLDF